jgi:hypothetical protein
MQGYGLETLAILSFAYTMPAQALPSYAQQTGLPCAQCHAIAFGAALTAYGRQFKLNAYALGEHHDSVPLALITILTYTSTAAALSEVVWAVSCAPTSVS